VRSVAGVRKRIAQANSAGFRSSARNGGAIWYRFHNDLLFGAASGFGVCAAAV
jgi:hypothetical protein